MILLYKNIEMMGQNPVESDNFAIKLSLQPIPINQIVI